MTTFATRQPVIVAPPDAPATPTKGGKRRSLPAIVLVLAMASLPLLRPAGPGNTGFADVGLIAATVVTALWVSGRGGRIVLPYAWPVALTIGSGALAALASGGSLLALVQDAFVFAWPIAVVNLARGPRLLDILVRSWGYSAVAWGCLLIIGVAAGVPWLAGTTARDGSRAALTLGDPNLAANYFLCALLVLRAAQRPRGRWKRALCCTIIVVALGLTLSNGGVLTLVIATALGWVFGIGRTRGLFPAIAALCTIGVLATVAVASIDLNTLADQAQQSTPLLRDSIGRQGESSGSRDTLVHTELQLWLTGDNLLGIGPGATEDTLRVRGAAYVKEAHNDYLAALVERGVIGALAIVVLGSIVAVRCRRIARPGALPPAYATVIPRPELLGALVVGVAASAALYETLHFRHVWALFGLIAALEIATRAHITRTGRRDPADDDTVHDDG
jgi:O-antigen ligase